MYDWRKMSESEREEMLAGRKAVSRPWHSVPHRFLAGRRRYIISGACYEHAPVIGSRSERMGEMSDLLCDIMEMWCDKLFAWTVLPNHYHAVVATMDIRALLKELGLMHGRTSYRWNGEEGQRGRKVWCNDVEREMRTEAHLWASINYVHHNAVKHGYVARWQDWPWTSAGSYLDAVGKERAREIWEKYPVLDYGAGWDD